ncbi:MULTISPECIES: hypothetical protein [Rhizobium]|uniref:Uncharacterized protein n=1 Tax=Rhizobium esperanzae TaxID=1967781 RepID=A0A7W6UM19_9HYPH|nr:MULTISPECIES: hypothetical protein [Rhizobium]MBB4440699.1 hypothetical protein [Rhizobium esperanzae]
MAGSPIEISVAALMMVKHGEVAALEPSGRGNRGHPRIERHFDDVGVPE